MEISKAVKEQAKPILAEIKKANSILLHCHPLPDPDSVCSGLAMKFALEQLGKKVTLIRGDSAIPQAFMHFPGADTIADKKFADVDLSQYDLFISQDSGSPEMISQNAPTFPLPIKTIVIDHHATNKGYADINLIDNTSPAVAFILYQLFKEWEIQITEQIALNLFMGTYTDTGGFRYPPTDYRVLAAASELTKIAPQYTDVIFKMENSESRQSLDYMALALSSIETFCDDHLALVSISKQQLKEKGIPEDVIRGISIANILKSVVGWNIGGTIIEREPGKVKLSFRTRDSSKYDVSKLAAALGGGGHRAAAGVAVNMTLDEAKNLVVKKVEELYNLRD